MITRKNLLLGVALMGLGVISPLWAQSIAPAGGPINITAGVLDVAQKKNQAIFQTHVVVVQADVTLTADKLTVDYAGKGSPKGSAGIEKLMAEGNVTITRKGPDGAENATGSVATYTPASRQIVLTGRTVTLSRGANVLEGDKLVYDLGTGNARVTNAQGPVKARFVPDNSKPSK